MITLYQAEWCPHSAKVRERLTELGVDFVARQVAPRPEQRGDVDSIPTLELEDGTRISGEDEILEHLETIEPWEHERGHQAQARAHRT